MGILALAMGLKGVACFVAGSGRSSGGMRSYDGYIDEIYSHLWSKDSSGKGCEHVMIPDTVIFKYRLIEVAAQP